LKSIFELQAFSGGGGVGKREGRSGGGRGVWKEKLPGGRIGTALLSVAVHLPFFLLNSSLVIKWNGKKKEKETYEEGKKKKKRGSLVYRVSSIAVHLRTDFAGCEPVRGNAREEKKKKKKTRPWPRSGKGGEGGGGGES